MTPVPGASLYGRIPLADIDPSEAGKCADTTPPAARRYGVRRSPGPATTRCSTSDARTWSTLLEATLVRSLAKHAILQGAANLTVSRIERGRPRFVVVPVPATRIAANPLLLRVFRQYGRCVAAAAVGGRRVLATNRQSVAKTLVCEANGPRTRRASYAGALPMARPGLEPGTPRFSGTTNGAGHTWRFAARMWRAAVSAQDGEIRADTSGFPWVLATKKRSVANPRVVQRLGPPARATVTRSRATYPSPSCASGQRTWSPPHAAHRSPVGSVPRAAPHPARGAGRLASAG
jgi:hypothetical protein